MTVNSHLEKIDATRKAHLFGNPSHGNANATIAHLANTLWLHTWTSWMVLFRVEMLDRKVRSFGNMRPTVGGGQLCLALPKFQRSKDNSTMKNLLPCLLGLNRCYDSLTMAIKNSAASTLLKPFVTLKKYQQKSWNVA